MNNLFPNNPMPLNHKIDVQYGANNIIKLLWNEIADIFITTKIENNYWYKEPKTVISIIIYKLNNAHNCIPAAIPTAFTDGFLSFP